MMVRVPYVTRSGDLRVYEYAPPERDDAVKRCRRALVRVKVLRNAGSPGPQGQRFYNATIEQMIARGEAVRDGDVVRAA